MKKNYCSKALLAITISGLIFSATANTAFAKISKNPNQIQTKVETTLKTADGLAKKYESLNLSQSDLTKLKTLYSEATALEQQNDDAALKKADKKWAQFEEILEKYYPKYSDNEDEKDEKDNETSNKFDASSKK